MPGAGRILVTGGMGSIGAFVVRALLGAGCPVVVLGRSHQVALLADLLPRLTVVLGDVQDRPDLERLAAEQGAECLCHCAGPTLAQFRADAAAAVDLTVRGTLSVLAAARAVRARRVVLLSSRSVYDVWDEGSPDPLTAGEDGPTTRTNLFGLSKLFAETLAERWAAEHGLSVVSLRLGLTWGPGKLRTHGASGVHGRLIGAAAHGAPFLLPRGGDQQDDLIYVRDAAAAIARVCAAVACRRPVYNLGSGAGTSLRQFADAVRSLFPAAPITIGPGRDPLGVGFKRGLILRKERFESEFGPLPVRGLAEAVQDYLRMTEGSDAIPG